MPERRRHPRIPCTLAVTVDDDPTPIVVTSRDVSLGGVFLYSPLPKALNETLRMAFQAGERRLQARGVVVHHLPGVGYGVQFDSFSEVADQLALAALLDSAENGAGAHNDAT